MSRLAQRDVDTCVNFLAPRALFRTDQRRRAAPSPPPMKDIMTCNQRHHSLATRAAFRVHLVLCLVSAGCSATMRVHTHNNAARVFVNGQQRGEGNEVAVVEPVGGKESFAIEARVTSECHSQLFVESRQQLGRVLGCTFAAMGGGATGGALGAVIGSSIAGSSPDETTVAQSALGGLAFGALVGGILCTFRGYVPPPDVDLDVSHCRAR